MTTRLTRRAGRLAITASLLALAIPSWSATALAADHAVDIAGFAFSPGSLTVSVGDTVTWANADAQGHTATADDGSFDTGTIAGSGSKSVTLTTAGTFAYHCKIHPSMTATLIVSGGAEATTPPTDTIAAAPSTGMPGTVGAPLVLALAALLGLALARRRFARDSIG
jgi:plastocyanin